MLVVVWLLCVVFAVHCVVCSCWWVVAELLTVTFVVFIVFLGICLGVVVYSGCTG